MKIIIGIILLTCFFVNKSYAVNGWEGNTFVHCSTGSNTPEDPRVVYMSEVFFASAESLPLATERIRGEYLSYLKEQGIYGKSCDSYGYPNNPPLEQVEEKRLKLIKYFNRSGTAILVQYPKK